MTDPLTSRQRRLLKSRSWKRNKKLADTLRRRNIFESTDLNLFEPPPLSTLMDSLRDALLYPEKYTDLWVELQAESVYELAACAERCFEALDWLQGDKK